MPRAAAIAAVGAALTLALSGCQAPFVGIADADTPSAMARVTPTTASPPPTTGRPRGQQNGGTAAATTTVAATATTAGAATPTLANGAAANGAAAATPTLANGAAAATPTLANGAAAATPTLANGAAANGAAANAAVDNPNCTLVVPPAPLTVAGLATPYRLSATDAKAGACHEANANQSAFVEATILDPATGALSIYRPLVIDDGTTPAAAPVTPKLPAGAVVGIWFGFQGDTLTLGNPGTCVNGAPGSPFGQFGYCGATEFFTAANAAVTAKKLTIPPLGTAKDGQPCPTTRDFSVVDQDQSDNLTTGYVALADGRTAQATPATIGLAGATQLSNASDNGLLVKFVDPALGCQPFTAPDQTAGGTATSLALNELQAAAFQGAPVALIPPNDPMALIDNTPSVTKTNLYRAGANMPPLNEATETGAAYCTNLGAVAPKRLALDKQFTGAAPSPDAAANTLFDFLVNRLTQSWTDLGCQQLINQGPPQVDGAAPAAAAAGQNNGAAVTTAAAAPGTTVAPTTAPPAPAAEQKAYANTTG